MAKSYKEFEKVYIGDSDIASLILAGGGLYTPIWTQTLSFGEDASYYTYVVNGKDVEIGAHYREVAKFKSWLKIYDDYELVKTFKANKIVVYRAGEMGCIIQLID